MTISTIIHTKNSESTVEAALKSVTWADEIIVVDMASKDKTLEIAANYQAKVFQFKDVGYVEPARNFGISKASSDWILILDADEEIPETLAKRIQKLTLLQTEAWQLPRKNIIFGQWIRHAGWWPDFNIRFFKKDSVFWPEAIHSVPRVRGEVGQLPAEEKLAIIHHNYPSVESFIDRLNTYTTITAAEKHKVTGSAFEAFWQEFERRFFLDEGYKDGEAGLHVCLLQAFYETVSHIKQWESAVKTNKAITPLPLINTVQQELAYWRADYQVKHAAIAPTRFYWQIRRKFKI